MPRQIHDANPDYGESPVDPSVHVPDDLAPFYHQFKPGYWAYVCPCCKYVFAPKWGGMPGSFRAHVHEYLHGSGCFFNPKSRAVAKAPKHADKAANF